MKKLDLSWFDRALMSVFPEYGMRRVRARVVTANLERHYEAAEYNRRTQNWKSNQSDADLVLRQAGRELRFHARDLIRNNGWARRGQNVVANNTVGWGIRAKATGPAATAAQQIWRSWAETTECESDNRQTFYGIQHLLMKNLFADGEVLIRKRYRRLSDGLTVPLQLQVLEADYINTAWNQLTSLAGGPIIQGIEFDKLGARAAYWLYPQHPGSGRNFATPVRISADEIIHVYDVERAGQTRGASWLAAAILSLKDLDHYEDAELMKQKIAACFAAFVVDTDGTASPLAEPGQGGDDSIETLEPGLISNLPPGRDVKFGNPPVMTSDALPVRTLRKIAAAIGVTYEDLSGDYSQVNFSSARMGRLAHWANVTHWQSNMLIPIACQGVWDWVMEAAEINGQVGRDENDKLPGATWTPPPMPMLEPDKEGLALQRLVRTGALTVSGMIREQGFDPETHLAELAADLKQLDALGIVLDSDPRKVTQVGQEQPSETTLKAPTAPPPARVTLTKALELVASTRNEES